MSQPVRTSFLAKFYPVLPPGYSHEFGSHKYVPSLTLVNRVEETDPTFEPKLNSQDIPFQNLANFGQYLKGKKLSILHLKIHRNRFVLHSASSTIFPGMVVMYSSDGQGGGIHAPTC